MKKLAIGLMAAALFAFLAYGSFADCGKCGHGPSKCSTQSSQTGCKMAGGKSCCSKAGCCKDGKGCGCCDKCGKNECCKDGKRCCDKCECKCCADKGSCAKMSGKGCCAKKDCCAKDGKGCGCCDKCGKGDCCCKDGKKCCDKCECSCCSSMGACKTKSADPTNQEIAPDPVCGMDVNAADSKITYEYKGKTYHFCSEACKDRFAKDPSKFIGD